MQQLQIRSLKKYYVDYIIADKAYDTNKIRKCINKEINASDQIPLKSNFKHGWYRRLSKKALINYVLDNLFSSKLIEKVFIAVSPNTLETTKYLKTGKTAEQS